MAEHVYTPSPVALEQAEQLLIQIALAASEADRSCFHLHGDLVGADVDPEAVSLELGRMRDVILRLGWMADLGCKKLGGVVEVKGGAEEWLLSATYQSIDKRAREVAA